VGHAERLSRGRVIDVAISRHGDPSVFTRHGYAADEAPEVTEELERKKIQAEELTSAAMEKCFDVLSDTERDALAVGTRAMFEALQNPVPVTR